MGLDSWDSMKEEGRVGVLVLLERIVEEEMRGDVREKEGAREEPGVGSAYGAA